MNVSDLASRIGNGHGAYAYKGVRITRVARGVSCGRVIRTLELENGTRVPVNGQGWVEVTPVRRDLAAGQVRVPLRTEVKAAVRERQTPRGEGLGLAASRRA